MLEDINQQDDIEAARRDIKCNGLDIPYDDFLTERSRLLRRFSLPLQANHGAAHSLDMLCQSAAAAAYLQDVLSWAEELQGALVGAIRCRIKGSVESHRSALSRKVTTRSEARPSRGA